MAAACGWRAGISEDDALRELLERNGGHLNRRTRLGRRRSAAWPRRALIPFALLLVIESRPPAAWAQVATTGNIRVVVTDQVGLSIPGATVTASAENTATTRVTVTDRQGLAELRALQPSAQYVVTVELEGFQMTRQADVLVRVGQTASTEMTLTVGNVTATVVVTAASPVVDVTSAVVAEDITLDLTEAVPNIRDTVFDGGLYTSLAGSLSGLTAGGLIAGDFFRPDEQQ